MIGVYLHLRARESDPTLAYEVNVVLVEEGEVLEVDGVGGATEGFCRRKGVGFSAGVEVDNGTGEGLISQGVTFFA